ncbi:MAG: thioredoxin family protein [Gammaproteobacteria bacterium]
MNPDNVTRLDDSAAVTGFVSDHAAALVYFGGDHCNVCQKVRPQVWSLMAERFPRIALAYVDTETNREAAAQHGVLSIPTLVVWFEQGEFLRKVRSFGLGELQRDLERPYGLFFD